MTLIAHGGRWNQQKPEDTSFQKLSQEKHPPPLETSGQCSPMFNGKLMMPGRFFENLGAGVGQDFR